MRVFLWVFSFHFLFTFQLTQFAYLKKNHYLCSRNLIIRVYDTATQTNKL